MIFFAKVAIMYDMDYIMELIAKFLAVTAILSMHEFAHAFVAYKCGDPTAKWSGRMTLNPVKHFDPIGLVMFAFVGFGWAKPVPINPDNFKNRRLGSFWTAIAGVFLNFIFAFLFYPVYSLAFSWFFGAATKTLGHYLFFYLAYYLFTFSLNFCAFNLLPLYPLDGFRVVDSFKKKRGRVYRFLRDYGYIILLGLLALSFWSDFLMQRTGAYQFGYLDVLGLVMSYLTSFLYKPVSLFWGLIL